MLRASGAHYHHIVDIELEYFQNIYLFASQSIAYTTLPKSHRFRADFIVTCKPQYLPLNWDVAHEHKREFGEYSVFRGDADR